jgi:hypothetical protein
LGTQSFGGVSGSKNGEDLIKDGMSISFHGLEKSIREKLIQAFSDNLKGLFYDNGYFFNPLLVSRRLALLVEDFIPS